MGSYLCVEAAWLAPSRPDESRNDLRFLPTGTQAGTDVCTRFPDQLRTQRELTI